MIVCALYEQIRLLCDGKCVYMNDWIITRSYRFILLSLIVYVNHNEIGHRKERSTNGMVKPEKLGSECDKSEEDILNT